MRLKSICQGVGGKPGMSGVLVTEDEKVSHVPLLMFEVHHLFLSLLMSWSWH